MKSFVVIRSIEAGYEYIKLKDLSKPNVYLEGNSYKFNTSILSRKPITKVRSDVQTSK